MDHLSGKTIETIVDLGMTPIDKAMGAGLDAVEMAINKPAIETIESQDIPGQLLLDLGIEPTVLGMTAALKATDQALNKPPIETIEERDIAALKAMNAALSKPAIEAPKKTTKSPPSYSRPTVYDVDDRGEIQPCDRELGGYVAIEDYDRLLAAYEGALSRMESIKELTEL